MNVEEYPSVGKWLSRLGESTRRVQRTYFKGFMKWVKLHGEAFSNYTPDQLVEYQRNADNGSKYDITDLAQRYILESEGTYKTKQVRYATIRSFFLHNRAELPKDKFNVKAGNGIKTPVQGNLTVEEIKAVILSCKPVFQACFTSMFQGALDQESFIYWNMNGYKDLLAQLQGNPEVVKIELQGRKKSRNVKPFYTFIGKDAIKAIENWLQHRPENAEAIFTNQYGKPITKNALSQYWIRHLRKLGYVPKEKFSSSATKTGKGLHEMRDTFRTLWSKSPANHIVGEFVMGHQIDKLGYDKSYRDEEYYRAEYLKAVPYLNLISGGEPFGRVDQSEIEKLRRENEALKRVQNERISELEARLEAVIKLVEEKASKE